MKMTIVTEEKHDSSDNEQFAIDVLMGLSSNPKRISPKYFYDDIGSDLFQKITQHPDYYPTKTEFSILEDLKDNLPKLINTNEIDIIELGAGDGHKSQLVIDGFLNANKKVNFYPIDISEMAMRQLEKTIKPDPKLSIHGVVAEYFEGLRFTRKNSTNPQLILFLGSNIGNFDQVQAQGFLRKIWKGLNDNDHVLIGFDLKKDIKTLTKAYNDSQNYTRDFNLNLLKRMNDELGANFDIDQFKHVGSYNPILGAMESYLIPIKEQDIFIKELKRSFHFKAYEPLHLEYSFKFLKSDIESLAEQTGFHVTEHFTDKKSYFIDSLWRVIKEH